MMKLKLGMPYFWIADFTYWQAMRWKNHLLGSAVI
jgi:hypothetical protein